MLTALVLFSINDYIKIKLFTDMLGIKFIPHTLFIQTQRLYFAPAIEDYWKKTWQKILKVLKDYSELCLCGNGCNDCLGHSAKEVDFLPEDILDMQDLSAIKNKKIDLMYDIFLGKGCNYYTQSISKTISF